MAGCSQLGSSEPTKSSNAHYRLLWNDEFKGPAGRAPDPRKWMEVIGGGGWGNRELENYTARSANASLDGHGHLVITARRDDLGGRWRYTSARLETLGRFQFKYGRIEARIQVPLQPGLWPTFWMLGSDHPRVGWPRSGELDAMEFQGQNPFRLVATLHGPTARGFAWQINRLKHSTSRFDGFHVYGIDWSHNKILFSLDGQVYGEVIPQALSRRDRWVFNRPFYVLLNLAVGGFWVGPPTGSTRFPARMLVDWVRVWHPTGA